jgi:hypothetical protein
MIHESTIGTVFDESRSEEVTKYQRSIAGFLLLEENDLFAPISCFNIGGSVS